MTRVPTYMTNINLLNSTIKNKQNFELYNFQAVTGLKAQTYSGYGMTAYSIVNLEASLNVANNFLENNKLLATEISTMATSMDAISNAT
ncbi:MAG: hypothetical protein IKA03_06470, partial [Alphaproteobacteria bacterium]|nr:hypothetical protein [Alphaproteobacteria bacterium]